MTATFEQQLEGDRAFWHPIFIFFLGTSFAALNWWRMGWKRKAIVFLFVSIIVSLLKEWVGQRPFFIVYLDSTQENNSLLYLPLLVSLVYALALSIIAAHDIRMFSRSGARTNSVNWKITFLFILSTALISMGAEFSIDYFAQTTKYCRFPRLQDLLHENMVLNQSDLKRVLTNRYDLECRVVGVEFYDDNVIDNQQNEIVDITSYTFLGRALGNTDSSLHVYQEVELHQNTITQSSVDSLMHSKQSTVSTREISIEALHATYIQYSCYSAEEGTECFVVLGYKNILSWLRVSHDEFSDKEFMEMLAVIVHNTDERMYQYETNSP